MNAPPYRPFRFRVDGPAGSPSGIHADLTDELQRRLRLLNFLGVPASLLMLGLALATGQVAFLAKAPSDRYASVDESAEALGLALDGASEHVFPGARSR